MVKIVDIQDRYDKVYAGWDSEVEFDAIVVTMFIDDEEMFNEHYFGRETDEEYAILMNADHEFYGYLPEWCFEGLRSRNIKDIREYIEKNFD